MLRRFTPFILVFLVSAFAMEAQVPTTSPTPSKANPRPASMAESVKGEPFDKADVAAMASQCVKLDTESGVIEIEMFPESAPESVRNFLNLAATGYFDSTTFSRVVPDFVIQGGNLSTGDKWNAQTSARARKTIPDEPNKILHERGILSMARSDEPNTATTNFFILVSEASYLDGKFAAFGRVKSGMDVVDAINKAKVENETPEKPVKIKKAAVAPCVAASGHM